nr:ATP-binding cassette domain-containing protein [Actinomycetota bacterium]
MTAEWRRSLVALLQAAWRADRAGVATVFALNILGQLFWLASMFGVKLLFDAAVDAEPRRAVAAAVLIAGVGQLSQLFGLRQWTTSIRVTERTSQLLDEELMAVTGGIPGIEHHERPEYADRIALVRQERRRIGFAAYVVALNVRIAVQLAGSVLLLVRLHPLLVVLPGFAALSFLTQSRAQRLVDTAAEDTAGATRRRRELFDLLTSAPAGKEVRVFGLRDELLGRHRELAEDIDRRLSGAALRAAVVQGTGRIAFALGYIASIGLVLQRATTGGATPGDVALAITLAAVLNSQVAQAAEEFAYLTRMIAVGQHYVWLRDYAVAAQPDLPNPAPLPEPVRQGLRLEGVSFRYPGGGGLVLDSVSFDLPAGGTVALVGENGSGKTTLAKLLLRMYEPDEGRITLDGIDIRDFDITAYRSRLSAAFQDYCRFEFSVRESVGVGEVARIGDD